MEQCPKEQTHLLGNQLSNTPYYADSPKRHGTIILGKTKRTCVGQHTKVSRSGATVYMAGFPQPRHGPRKSAGASAKGEGGGDEGHNGSPTSGLR